MGQILQELKVRACLKNHSRNLHAPLCGIFYPNSVAVARYAPSSGQNLPQIVTHILQKAFFKHALSQKRSRFSKYGRSALFNRIKGVPCFNYKYLPDSNADQEYTTDGL
mgnify:CR=1 FL=1